MSNRECRCDKVVQNCMSEPEVPGFHGWNIKGRDRSAGDPKMGTVFRPSRFIPVLSNQVHKIPFDLCIKGDRFCHIRMDADGRYKERRGN